MSRQTALGIYSNRNQVQLNKALIAQIAAEGATEGSLLQLYLNELSWAESLTYDRAVPIHDKNGSVANPRAWARTGDGTLGVLGTGTLQTLEDVGFTSIEDAQAVYPAAVALTDSFDSTVIQHTENLVGAAGGGRVVLYGQPSIYMLNKPYVKRAWVITEGDGTGFHPWDGSNGGTVLFKVFNGDLVTATDVHGFQLHTLGLYGNKEEFTGRGIVILGTTGLGTGHPRFWRMKDVTVNRTEGIGLDMSVTGTHWMDGVEVRGTGGHGIKMVSVTDYHYSNISVGAAGEQEAAESDGVNASGDISGLWVNSKFWQNHINFNSTSAFRMVNGTLEKGRLWGMRIAGSGTRIANLTFVRNGTSQESSSGGLLIDNREHNIVLGSTFSDPEAFAGQRYCIRELGGSANHNIIALNSLRDYTVEPITWSGVNSIVRLNAGYTAPGDILVVTATPEGSITAPIGAFASDRTNGKLYFKATGTGNTGWREVAFV